MHFFLSRLIIRNAKINKLLKQIQAIINMQGINHPAYEDKRLD